MSPGDRLKLTDLLLAMPAWKRVAFMLLCAERVLAVAKLVLVERGYERPIVPRVAVDTVWEWLETSVMPPDLEGLRARAAAEWPSAPRDTAAFVWAKAARDVALICLSAMNRHQPVAGTEAATIARQAIARALEVTRPAQASGRTSAAAMALADPMMQAELRAQFEDAVSLRALTEVRLLVARALASARRHITVLDLRAHAPVASMARPRRRA